MVTAQGAVCRGRGHGAGAGLDWLTDVGVLVRLLPQINAEFGLSPAQIETLAPDRRIVVYKAISAAGGLLVGKVVTRELVLRLVQLVGVRLTTQQAAKYVPLAGQAVSAALTFRRSSTSASSTSSNAWPWPVSCSCRRRRAATETPAATMTGSSGRSAAW
jgi:hypothetical protein